MACVLVSIGRGFLTGEEARGAVGSCGCVGEAAACHPPGSRKAGGRWLLQGEAGLAGHRLCVSWAWLHSSPYLLYVPPAHSTAPASCPLLPSPVCVFVLAAAVAHAWLHDQCARWSPEVHDPE